MNDKFEEYAVLDAKIRELTAKKDQVKIDILSDMSARGVGSEEHGVGKFTVSKLKKWTYPEYVSSAEDTYKALKAKSESVGDAKFEEVDSLRFTLVKI